MKNKESFCGSRDGAVVRALASHQCGPGSIPGLGVVCGLSLLLVLVPAPRVFLRVLRFSSLHKNQHFQIPIRPGNGGEKSHSMDSTEIPIFVQYLWTVFSVWDQELYRLASGKSTPHFSIFLGSLKLTIQEIVTL